MGTYQINAPVLKAWRILLTWCLLLWTSAGAWAITNPESHCSRVAAGAISNARYYDPLLGRFIQADTMIPDLGNPQSYNRYSYCLNNPLKYTDPSGHSIEDYVLGSTGLAGFVASSRADAWAKTVGNRSGNLGFKSFADAQNSLAEQKDPMGLNADIRFANERAAAVSVTAQAAAGMAKTEIAVEAAIVAPEAKAVMEETAAEKATGPYANLEDHPSDGPGKDFTRSQKSKILDANEARKGGILRDDRTGEPLCDLNNPKKM